MNCTSTITTLNLVAQKTGAGTGGDITAEGDLLVKGNATQTVIYLSKVHLSSLLL